MAPPSRYPWSLLWRAGTSSEHVHAVLGCARALSRRLGWLEAPGSGDRLSTILLNPGHVISDRDKSFCELRFPSDARCGSLQGGFHPLDGRILPE